MIREDADDGSDWVDICIPEGMLEQVYPVNYASWTMTANPWLQEVDALLVDVATRLYEAVPFQLGIIGPDVSGIAYNRSLGQFRQGHYLLPSALQDKIPETARPVRLLPDLWYVSAED